jgi:hypothetical protein
MLRSTISGPRRHRALPRSHRLRVARHHRHRLDSPARRVQPGLDTRDHISRERRLRERHHAPSVHTGRAERCVILHALQSSTEHDSSRLCGRRWPRRYHQCLQPRLRKRRAGMCPRRPHPERMRIACVGGGHHHLRVLGLVCCFIVPNCLHAENLSGQPRSGRTFNVCTT